MMMMIVLLVGIFCPTIIFGLDFLPERARHGHAQKLFDSINPSAGTFFHVDTYHNINSYFKLLNMSQSSN